MQSHRFEADADVFLCTCTASHRSERDVNTFGLYFLVSLGEMDQTTASWFGGVGGGDDVDSWWLTLLRGVIRILAFKIVITSPSAGVYRRRE